MFESLKAHLETTGQEIESHLTGLASLRADAEAAKNAVVEKFEEMEAWLKVQRDAIEAKFEHAKTELSTEVSTAKSDAANTAATVETAMSTEVGTVKTDLTNTIVSDATTVATEANTTSAV